MDGVTAADSAQEYWTADEVAKRFRMHRSTVYRKAKSGELPAYYIGRMPRFKVVELEEQMARQRTERERRGRLLRFEDW